LLAWIALDGLKKAQPVHNLPTKHTIMEADTSGRESNLPSNTELQLHMSDTAAKPSVSMLDPLPEGGTHADQTSEAPIGDEQMARVSSYKSPIELLSAPSRGKVRDWHAVHTVHHAGLKGVPAGLELQCGAFGSHLSALHAHLINSHILRVLNTLRLGMCVQVTIASRRLDTGELVEPEVIHLQDYPSAHDASIGGEL
jgi:hypothetical protein